MKIFRTTSDHLSYRPEVWHYADAANLQVSQWISWGMTEYVVERVAWSGPQIKLELHCPNKPDVPHILTLRPDLRIKCSQYSR